MGSASSITGSIRRDTSVQSLISTPPSLSINTRRYHEAPSLTNSLEKDGKKEVYETKEKIDLLNADTLSVVAREANPRLVFLYLNTKIIKERVRVDTMSHE